MRNSFILALLLILTTISCAPKGPSVFQVGIFNRDVAQVALNTKKIAKNTKDSELVLAEIKEIQSRVSDKNPLDSTTKDTTETKHKAKASSTNPH